jgi:phage-related protein
MSEVLWSGLVTALGAIAKAAFTALGQLLSGIITTFPQWAPELMKAAVMLFVNIIQGIINVTVDVLNAVADLIGQMLSAVYDSGRQFFEAGANMVQGLINGIVSNISGVVDAIVGGVTNAVNAVKGFLRIGSPSKLMAEFGGYTMEGFAQGIRADSSAKKAMHDAAGEVYGAASGKIDYSSAGDVGSQGMSGGGLAINVYVDGRAYEDYNALGTGIGRAIAFEVKARGLA